MRAHKLLEDMRRNPQADWTIENVETVCNGFGVTCSKPKNGSHYKVSHARMQEILTVPFKRPIKAVYIRKLVEFIDSVKE